MKKLLLGGSLALLVTALIVAVAPAHHKRNSGLRAFLNGFSEVPANSTTGHGKFKAKRENGSITFELSYQDLEGTAQAAHIHFAQRDVNGGVAAFLCGGGGKPACPPSGTVTGNIAASDVIGPAGQGIAAGELDELVRAIKHGVTYVNVHTDKFPDGEIRGQIGRGGKGHFGHKPNGRHNGNGDD
jgi:CHRD domain-containing protein